MSLNQVAHYNALSAGLRAELEKKIKSFGARVRYRFKIEKPNPEPTKHDGEFIFPSSYTLDPTQFSIIDTFEKEGTNRSKLIAMVAGLDEKGLPNKFTKLRIRGIQGGILDLDLSEGHPDIEMAMYLELHPKLENGMFQNKTLIPVVKRIDEVGDAAIKVENRKAKLKALNAALDMDDKKIVQFADAMQWDSTMDVKVLRNKTEELAETNPEFFNDLVSGKSLEYKATVKQALDRKIIDFDPAEYKIKWSGNQQTIAMLAPNGEGTHIDKFSEWLMVSGDKANEAYKKIKELLPK